jgi:hypothetical protein
MPIFCQFDPQNAYFLSISAHFPIKNRHVFDPAPIAATLDTPVIAWAFKWLSVFRDDTARGSKAKM